VRLVSDALNIGLGTVNRVMSSYNKDPTSTNKPMQLWKEDEKLEENFLSKLTKLKKIFHYTMKKSVFY
jgi:hypothetical protein